MGPIMSDSSIAVQGYNNCTSTISYCDITLKMDYLFLQHLQLVQVRLQIRDSNCIPVTGVIKVIKLSWWHASDNGCEDY